MTDEIRNATRIAVDIVFKQVNDNLHLESTTTFNKQQQNGYKIATIEFIADSDHEEDHKNDCAVLQSIAGVNPKIRNIVSLKLSHCKLSNIPKSFCVLSLKSLDLSHNILKTVPLCISIGLPDLEEINLSHNEIRSFAFEPKCIRKLRILNLEQNMLVNVPIWLLRVKSSNLETFLYSDNDLTSLKKACFASTTLYKLTNLYLRNCCLMDDDFKVLKTIRTLKTLDIGNIGNKNYNGISKLELLFDEAHFANYIETLSACNISLSYIPENVANLKYLKYINVSNNNLSWLPDNIVCLRNLEYLNFSYNKVVRLPPDCHKLENLADLIAPFNSLAYVPAFNLPRLKYIDLYSNDISAFEFNWDNLQMADLEQNFIDTTQLPVKYTQCLNALRSKHHDQSRLFNEREDSYLESNESPRHSWSSSSSVSSYADVNDIEIKDEFEKNIMNFSVESHNAEEEEQWDAVVQDQFTNISLSDSEWQGELAVKKIKKIFKRTESMPDYVYEDAD